MARILKLALLVLAVIVLTVLVVRAFDARRSPALQPWHTYVPKEMRATELDAADWAAYLKAEDQVFEAVRANVSFAPDPGGKSTPNRYDRTSPIYPPRFAHDWNRSFVLEPAGKPAGAVVLVHGLTDAPYSLRHVANRYRERGFVVIGIRMPGHGTVPAGLTAAKWEDWQAATRLAVREARRRTDPAAPLHLVGYSNGGALVTKYALDALENTTLARPDRIVLISPMIGVTRFARFASVAGWPALLPAFSAAAWLDIVPEFNPFKYNSFPVNAARQSHRLTAALQEQIGRLANEGRLADIAPILTFQSVVDFTVSTPAILHALYAFLPANGSEMVVFDVNRSVNFSPLLRTSADTALARLTPATPQAFAFTVVGNSGADAAATLARTTRAGETTQVTRALALPYPPQVYSLSHLALPMPIDDSLYGLEPVPGVEFGANLGALAVRGERGALVVNMDFLTRLASNPFFPYILERIEEGIDRPAVRAAPAAAGASPAPRPRLPDKSQFDEFADTLSPSEGAP